MDIGALVKDQYTIIEHIGRGGMADVWSARDQRLRRMVAIKTIAVGMTQDVDPLALFEKEAQTIAQMEHPHILPIYDFGEYDSSLYIVMRYVTGGSLEHQLGTGALPVNEVLRIGDAIAKALDYAHENNVIHLDLKPGNILLDSSQVPYLADFGLATVLDPEGRARNPGSGTLLYMAPEQMVSELIDHRADIYSFCVMLYHMLTGELPYVGAQPLALRQLQTGDELPALADIVPDLPPELTAILRLGTAMEPNIRPNTHSEIIEQMQNVLQPGTSNVFLGDEEFDTYGFDDADLYPSSAGQDLAFSDSGLLEAVDIYSRARHNWQGGQGRFLLGVTHFMLMSDYYQAAEHYGLTIDENGYQVLLRGALEYDYELDYWWLQLDDADRRWVCLHALRSGNAPARIRSMYRLETLPDDTGAPVIPKLVTQALEIETDHTAKIAALQVLGTRARLIKPKRSIEIKTEYRGRLISTITRLGIQAGAPAVWQAAVYSPEIDQLIASMVFDDSNQVAEFAARTVGQMRSLTGLHYIATEQQNKRPGALEALAFIRDEAPTLPAEVVSRQGRFYAWITNTARRLTDEPLHAILRFVLVLLGGWIAMGEQVYNLFRSQQLFTPQRWANTIAVGLVFGLFIAITYMVSNEMSRRLRGFWSWWLRLLLFGALGYLLAVLSFGGFTWMFYQFNPSWDLMRLGGGALAFSFVISALFVIEGWQSLILTTVLVFLPILATHSNFNHHEVFTIVPTPLIGWVVGAYLGWVVARHTLWPPLGSRFSHAVNIVGGAAAGLSWALLIWFWLQRILVGVASGQPITWDHVLVLFLVTTVLGFMNTFRLTPGAYLTLLATFTATFVTLYAMISWQFFDQTTIMPVDLPGQPVFELVYARGFTFAPVPDAPIFYYDDLTNVFTVTLPMVFVIALGANSLDLFHSLCRFIGKAKNSEERGGWLSGVLLSVMLISLMVGILSLFSLKVSLVLALFWSLWGFVTFIVALATWRWALWSARALLLSGIVALVGAFVFDATTITMRAGAGLWPELLQTLPIQIGDGPQPFIDTSVSVLAIWAMWSTVLGLFVWGAWRRQLWAGIGLIVLSIAWFVIAIFSNIQGSVAVFTMTHLALLVYAIQPHYGQMEAGRLPLFATGQGTPAEPASPEHFMPTKQALFATRVASDVDEMPTERDPAQAVSYSAEADEAVQNTTTDFQVEASRFDSQSEAATQAKVKISTEKIRKQNTKPVVPVVDEGTTKPRITLNTDRLRSKPISPPETEADTDENDE